MNVSSKWIKRIFVVLAVGVFCYFIIGEIVMPRDEFYTTYEAEDVALSWVYVDEDGTRTPVDDALMDSLSTEQWYTFEATLPEGLSDDTNFCFRVSRQDVNWYVDGALRQSYERASTSLFHNNGAALLIFVPVDASDSGKTLTMETCFAYENDGIFSDVYYGNRTSIWRHYFGDSGVEIILAFVALLFGLATVGATIYLHRKYQASDTLAYSGWGIILASFWLIGNSNLRQLIVPSLTIINDMNFYMVILLPIPLMIFMDEIQKKRYHKRYAFVYWLAVFDFLICFFLNITGVAEYARTFALPAIVCVLMTIFLIVSMIQDAITHHIAEYRVVAIGITIALVGGLVQLLLYLLDFSYMNNNIMMVIGIYMVLITSIINVAQDVVKEEQERDRALSLSEEKSSFFSSVSHELRTPINAILGMNHAIIRDTTQEQIREDAYDVEQAGKYLLSLVNDILDYSKIDSGKMRIIPVEYSIQTLLSDVEKLMRNKAEEKEIKLRFDISKELPKRLIGDDIRIRQILINLISNALKYTDTGSVTVSVKGDPREEGYELFISVADTGRGIKEEDLQALYTEFVRIDEAASRNEGGTGLGMSITKRLLELMDSRLEVKSIYGQGSTFFFTLMQQYAHAQPVVADEQTQSHHLEDISADVSILVVDDQPVNTKVFSKFFDHTNCRVMSAGGGKHAIELARNLDFTMIFLDHMMPEMDGVETLHQLRAIGNESICVALTANASSNARQFYLDAGFDDFLTKPILLPDLEEVLYRHLPEEAYEKKAPTIDSITVHGYEMPYLSHVNWETAFSYFPTYELLYEAVSEFLKSAEAEEKKLRDLCGKLETNADGYLNYQRTIHGMKSVLELLGAAEFAKLAEKLEHAAKEHNADVILEYTEEFLSDWRTLTEELSLV